jgi:hypothetical protein
MCHFSCAIMNRIPDSFRVRMRIIRASCVSEQPSGPFAKGTPCCFDDLPAIRTHTGLLQRILSPFEGILPDLTKRDEPIFTGLAAVKVMLRPVTSRDGMSSS